jgi:predicted GNAT family N-acyltransferase
MQSDAFSVQMVSWQEHGPTLAEIRQRVFVVEQNVPEALERDGLDWQCIHVLARDREGRGLGTARLMLDARIGRMAVLSAWRGHGVGAAMLRALMAAARERGECEVRLHAQLQAAGFYARYGFRAQGEPYQEAGIAHVHMVARL